MTERHQYKLRAEVFTDLVELADALFPNGGALRFESFSIHASYPHGLPHFEMEITTPLSLDDLLAVIEGIDDGHVMYQTLQPIEHYTGERDWDRKA